MKLLVTGGAGFIGSNYIRMLFSGHLKGVSSVVVLDKLTYAGNKLNIASVLSNPVFSFIQADICDRASIKSLLTDVDAVINFAAESHVDRSITGAEDFIRTNIVGVQVLLDSLMETGRNIRFLQVSTDEVYGSIEVGSWTEDWPLQPNSPYSASKASSELLLRSYNRTHGMDIVITRCSNNYGTHHFPEKLIPLFITNLLDGKKVPVYGNGKNIRDWLHVDDHCRGIHAALIDGRPGEIYNIGGGRELTNLEIAGHILDAMGADNSSIEFVADRKGHDLRYSVDWTKINRELGYEPQVKFEDGLRETIEWYRNNREWWEPLKQRAGL